MFVGTRKKVVGGQIPTPLTPQEGDIDMTAYRSHNVRLNSGRIEVSDTHDPWEQGGGSRLVH